MSASSIPVGVVFGKGKGIKWEPIHDSEFIPQLKQQSEYFPGASLNMILTDAYLVLTASLFLTPPCFHKPAMEVAAAARVLALKSMPSPASALWSIRKSRSASSLS